MKTKKGKAKHSTKSPYAKKKVQGKKGTYDVPKPTKHSKTGGR
jgi:hypothetical protein